MKRIPRVVVALARGRSLGRGEIRGIIDYANQSGPWLFYSPTISDSLKLDTIVSKPDGIIASVWNPKHVDMLYDLGIPAIAQGGTKKIMNLPYIRFNWRATGKMAAEHLISRGFTNFAFCGAMDQIWSIGRRKSFSRHILEAGFKTYLYETTFAKIHFPIPEEMLNLTQWLKSLPKPIGLMACNDVYARCIAEACLLIGIEVPNDVDDPPAFVQYRFQL
jgi:LacI family transcriptional regulator